jgi:hypothetical protein
MLPMLFHGGWDTIALALTFWALVFLLPLVVLFFLVRTILRRTRKSR